MKFIIRTFHETDDVHKSLLGNNETYIKVYNKKRKDGLIYNSAASKSEATIFDNKSTENKIILSIIKRNLKNHGINYRIIEIEET